MFAFLMSEAMTPFYQNVTSFPTVVFSFFLLISVAFWLVAILGVVDIDVLDLPEVDGVDGNSINGAALLVKWGLNGVPFVVVISIVSLVGWAFSFYAVLLIAPSSFIGVIHWVIDSVIFISSLILAVVISSQIIRPIRGLFNKMSHDTQQQVIGQIAIVRTARVDENFGEAVFNDGGAGLILKVRSFGSDKFKRNDRVVLIEYLEDVNAYRVISEGEFLKN